jgi:tripartite-type tricarboxylate transporter receptor subunit TctC
MIHRRDLLAGLLGTSVASRAAAQAPSRTARMLVGFPPGGSIDLVARALVEHVKVPPSAATMIVDSRPGAGGRLALEALKAALPDGLTVGLTPGDQLTLFPSIYHRLSYDPLRDFAPISTVCTFPFALTIGPLVPMEVVTVADFMAWCRANPKQANFGSPGEGTRPHFMGAALARAAGVELTHLPYKGGPAALQDLVAGQVAAMVSVLSNVLPHARSGRLRILAVSAPQRSTLLPSTPTAREAGYAAFEGEEWFGVLAPTSTSAETIKAWNEAIRNALALESVITALSSQAFRPAPSTPQELSAMIRSDLERWRRVVNEANFKLTD